MAKKLELRFTNIEGKVATISIDDPVEPVNVAAVTAAMDVIIAQNIFFSSGGQLVGKAGARIVDRNVTDVAIV